MSEEPYIEIVDMKDLEDGGALVTFEMDHESTILFAKIGLLKVLTDAANKVIENES